jgi:hypothetical protein
MFFHSNTTKKTACVHQKNKRKPGNYVTNSKEKGKEDTTRSEDLEGLHQDSLLFLKAVLAHTSLVSVAATQSTSARTIPSALSMAEANQ